VQDLIGPGSKRTMMHTPPGASRYSLFRRDVEYLKEQDDSRKVPAQPRERFPLIHTPQSKHLQPTASFAMRLFWLLSAAAFSVAVAIPTENTAKDSLVERQCPCDCVSACCRPTTSEPQFKLTYGTHINRTIRSVEEIVLAAAIPSHARTVLYAV
jgi:hypothetical protein